MQIVTNEFQFTKQQYFQVLVKSSFRRGAWIDLLIMAFAVQEIVTKGLTKSAAFMGGFAVIYPLYLVVSSWLFANKKSHNELMFRERYFEINDQEMTVHFKKGPSEKLSLSNITMVKKKPQSYELFLSKKQMIQLPLAAFKDRGQIEDFERIFRNKKLLA